MNDSAYTRTSFDTLKLARERADATLRENHDATQLQRPLPRASFVRANDMHSHLFADDPASFAYACRVESANEREERERFDEGKRRRQLRAREARRAATLAKHGELYSNEA